MKKRMGLVFLCSIIQLLAAHPAISQNQAFYQSAREISLTDYEAELNHDADLIRNVGDNPIEIARLRNSLPSAWMVEAGTTKVNISSEWLNSTLAQMQSHPEKSDTLSRDLVMRLAAMRQSALAFTGSFGQQAGHSSDAPRRLTAIFQRREFHDLSGPSEWDRWVVRAERWIGDKLLWVLQHIHVGANTGNFFAWSVIAIAFLALCYGVYRSLASSTRRIRLPRFDPAPPSDARQWTNEALAAAERGNYREAIHCAYWAGVSRLEDLNLLTRDRARTPRESLALLNSHPDQQTFLRELTRRFEPIWYGYRPASETDWSSVRTQLERMGCLKPLTAATASS